jgi:sulfur carrier protein
VIEVWINGTARVVTATDIRGLLIELGHDPGGRGIAIARNGEVVRRGEWERATLVAGDRIDIVGAVQGG